MSTQETHVIYIDDLLITRNDTMRIACVKAFLQMHLTIQDFGAPSTLWASSFIVGIEIWFLTHWK